MNEVIDLSSDPIEPDEFQPWSQSQGEIINLSDEEEPEIYVDVLRSETSLLSRTTFKSPHTKASESTARDNLLDLANWVSSDDESISADLRLTPRQPLKDSPVQPATTHIPIINSFPSSPVGEKTFDFGTAFGFDLAPAVTSPEIETAMPILDEPRSSRVPNGQESRQATPKPHSSPPHAESQKRKAHALNQTSDPVESSSPVKSPPAKKRGGSTTTTHSTGVELSAKAWKDANRVTRRKHDILSEMVIEIALCLEERIETDHFRSVFLLPKVRSSYLELPLISWRRRVSAMYNKEKDMFEPCELTELPERVFVLFYEPNVLIDKLKSGLISDDIERAKNRAKVQGVGEDVYVLIMVPAINDYLRKLQTVENRQYRAKTLQQLNQAQAKASRKKNDGKSISASEASRLLVESEVNLGINIFHPKTIEEGIDWLHSFTYTIGSSVYDKFERNPEFANIGNIKSGSNPKGTYIEMVKKFNLMTDPKAQNLYQYYASPLSLYRRLLEHDDLGSVQGRGIVPPSVNKLMKKVFTSEDPNAVITD